MSAILIIININERKFMKLNTKLILYLALFISTTFPQETILKQTTFSSLAVNKNGENSGALLGTVGQPFVGKLENNNIIISTGFWGNVANVLLGVEDFLPTEFAISNAYPNPFNPTVMIDFQIPEKTDVKIMVFDVLGRLTFSREQKFSEAGKYQFKWHGITNSGKTIASGIYFVAIQHETKVYNQKITFLK